MSKNIVIKEGGIGKQITAYKLKTNLVGGGSCLWVPEDETTLGTKAITKDGTYKAVDDGYYGYSEVSVSGIGRATGTGPDGETHTYEEDGTGGITDTILPESISVVTPPTITTYADGATIDFSGMVVKAYLKSGGLWTDTTHPDGVIPINELTLPVTIANADDVSGETASSSLETEPAQPLKIGGHLELKNSWSVEGIDYEQIVTITGGTFLVVQYTDTPSSLTYICAGTSNGSVTVHSVNKRLDTGEIIEERTTQADFYRAYTYDGKTAYYYISGYSGPNTQVVSPSPEHLNSSRQITDGTIAWTIVYGDISGGEQVIPVQWLRGDGKTLESSFDITVT